MALDSSEGCAGFFEGNVAVAPGSESTLYSHKNPKKSLQKHLSGAPRQRRRARTDGLENRSIQ